MTAARRLWRVTVALAQFARRHVPKRLLPVFAACLLIPGPLDELAVLAVVAFIVLRDAGKRAELAAVVRTAWNAS